jgi:riboflavin kinase / FMN adenylyltransferase
VIVKADSWYGETDKMERFTALKVSRRFRTPVVTLGNFDGIHLGHRKIFNRLIERARELGGESLVYTFEPHPIKVLHPGRAVPLITSYEERASLVECIGVDVFISVPFDQEFARQSARDFVEKVLHDALGARQVLVGYDYAFGRGREGNRDLLQEMGKTLGFEVEVVPPVLLDGIAVSSSLIRGAVQSGDVALANLMLGREFTVDGTVQAGHRRGRELGYPTANLSLQTELVPKTGVYAVRVYLADSSEPLGGMANLGTNPTFGDQGLTFEVHVFDFGDDLYGKQIRVAFVDRLRDETKFPSAQALIEQIRRDEEISRSLLQGKPV